MKSVLALFFKDVSSELRTRYALNALVMFVVTSIAITLFAVAAETSSSLVLAGVLWILIFFSSMSGLSRTFVSEEERGTTLLLQLLAIPSVIFRGKLLFNILLMLFLNILTVVLYMVLVDDFIVKNFGIFVLTIFLGTLCLATSSTILAAIVAKANTKGTLYPVLSFPILLPLLISVISLTKLAVEGAEWSKTIQDFQVLIAYLIIALTASLLLFDFIWKE